MYSTFRDQRVCMYFQLKHLFVADEEWWCIQLRLTFMVNSLATGYGCASCSYTSGVSCCIV